MSFFGPGQNQESISTINSNENDKFVADICKDLQNLWTQRIETFKSSNDSLFFIERNINTFNKVLEEYTKLAKQDFTVAILLSYILTIHNIPNNTDVKRYNAKFIKFFQTKHQEIADTFELIKVHIERYGNISDDGGLIMDERFGYDFSQNKEFFNNDLSEDWSSKMVSIMIELNKLADSTEMIAFTDRTGYYFKILMEFRLKVDHFFAVHNELVKKAGSSNIPTIDLNTTDESGRHMLDRLRLWFS